MLYVINGAMTIPSAEATEWHAGEPKPQGPKGRTAVMTFQADGDELQIILAALDSASKRDR